MFMWFIQAHPRSQLRKCGHCLPPSVYHKHWLLIMARRKIFTVNGIKHVMSSGPIHPLTNGLAEQPVQSKILRKV